MHGDLSPGGGGGGALSEVVFGCVCGRTGSMCMLECSDFPRCQVNEEWKSDTFLVNNFLSTCLVFWF